MSEIQNDLKCTVLTKDGPIRGFIEEIDTKTYYRFKKIPYAKPPVGLLRFMPPVPINSWNEELDCTQDASPPACFFFQYEIIGSEDCLYIEVCVPKIASDKNLPVMFWVGSLSFFLLMDPILDPKLIVKQDVIFVKCGFRLGPFGFLSINEFVAPGNNGMKDIVMALQWVQKNIKSFGGDPNNVTLFGSSSGGSIVHYMMLSPMASGLFHKAIIQSASAMNNWSLEKNPIQPVLKLAKELEIADTDITEIVKELKNLPYMDIMKACLKMQDELGSTEIIKFGGLFKPCVEKEFEGIPTFLCKSPALILKSGMINKVPLIIGAHNGEASVLQFINAAFYDNVEKKNGNICLMAPKCLAEYTCSKKISQKILNFYLDGAETLREDTKQQYLQLMSDYYFLYNVHNTIKIHKQIAPDCPIYYYIMNYAGEWVVPKILEFVNNSGHAAEYPFLFDIKLPGEGACKGSRDSMMTRCKMIKMWTNFAKYGNPTPNVNDPLLTITWDPVTSKEELDYLCISPNLTKGLNPFHDRMTFWDQLHKEHKFLRALAHFNDIGVFM